VVNFCWSVFKWGLLLGLAGAVIAALFLYQQMDEEIRRRVEERLARHFVDLKVTVHSAELVEGEGIKVRGLSILDPATTGPRAKIVHLEEAFLCCRADLNVLLSGPEISRVVLRRPTLRVTRQPDGSWNAEKLLRLPRSGSRPPAVWIESGTIEIFDPFQDPPVTLSLNSVNLEVLPSRQPPQPGFGPRACTVRGTLGGDFLRNMKIDGLVDPDGPKWAVDGSIEQLDVSRDMRNALPAELTERLSLLDSVRGLAALSFHASSGDSAGSPVRFEVAGQFKRGRVDDPRLPRPVTDLEATFRVNNEGLSIDNLSGSSGPSTLEVRSFRLGGFDFTRPMRLDAVVRNLELDQRLRDILPHALRQEWDKFLPAGKIHADVKLDYDGRNWTPELTVECVDAAFTYYKFPYRLEHVQGQVEWRNDVVTLQVTGQSGSRPIHVWGEVVRPGPGSAFSIKAKSSDLPLDAKLFRALKENAREVVCSLNPRGTADVFFHSWRDQVGQPPHKYLDLTVKDGWVRYDKFPYPLGDVSGVIERHDDHWEFREFVGTNDTGRIGTTGQLDVTPEGNRLELRFIGKNVPLEEELRHALPQPNIRKLWKDLGLEGMVDFDATVRRLPGEDKPTLARLQADLHRETTSIHPVWFPYPLTNLEGTLVYGDCHVTSAKHLKAEHGGTQMRAAVDCHLFPDGSWSLRLVDLSAERLQLDRELLAALPQRLKDAVAGLNPGGPINVDGWLELAQGPRPVGGASPSLTDGKAGRFTSQWNLEFILQQGSIDVGVKLENLNGGVTLAGSYDGQTIHSRGELDLDSLSYKGVQFTRVLGPLEIKNNGVLLGSFVSRQPNQPVRAITAQLFGGTFCGNGSVALGAEPQYQLHATLTDGEASRLAQEMMAGRQHLTGRISGWARLGGSGRSLNGLGGVGRIELRDADIHELPLMVALLTMFGIRQPAQTAYTTSDVDFYIQGGHVYLTNIHIDGDAYNLEGSGLADFDSSIRLTFRALPGRRGWQLPPPFRELVGGASEQLMVIHVGGTLQDPIRFNEPFPGVAEALRQLQEEMQRPSRVRPMFPQAGERDLNGARRLPRHR